ncbi:hypothetical protein LJC07_01090 [Christensenellaceae bacterium OttesenSCG-928-L17]|nr:hypothetical protein [Christensenellaceae bacterium OttesenSCG-928-L17]
MQNDLVERYIYAVVRKLPRKMQNDVAEELRGLIQDMLDERCGDVLPTEKDIRVVLTELGAPAELSRKYSPTGEKSLIGPDYYASYLFVLRIVLCAVAGGLLLSQIILWATEPVTTGELLLSIGEWLGNTFVGLLCAFAAVTISFAVFGRTGKQISFQNDGNNLDDLPPVPTKENEKISRVGAIVGICLSVLFTVLFLAIPNVIGGYFEPVGWVPLLQREALQSVWYLVAGMGVLGVFKEIIRLMEGRRTMRVMVITLLVDVLTFALLIWFVRGGFVVNPVFLEQMQILAGEGGEIVTLLFSNLGTILFAAFALGLVMDIITTVTHALKNTKSGGSLA